MNYRRLRSLLQNSVDVIGVIDEDGNFLYVSPSVERVLGYKADDLVSRKVLKSLPLHPEDVDKARDIFARSLGEPGGRVAGELRAWHSDGSWRWMDVTATNLLHDPDVRGVVSNFHDITERKRAEDEARKQNEYLDALHETTLGLMNRLDPDDLLHAIVTRAAALMDTEHGYIYAGEPGAAQLRVRVGTGLFGKLVGLRLSPGEGLAGKVWQTGEPHAVHDYHEWSGRSGQFDNSPRLVRAVAGVPVRSGQDVVGVIALAYTQEGRRFEAGEMAVLTRFAELASVALDNARLYASAQQDLAERRRTEEELARRARAAALNSEVTAALTQSGSVRAALQCCTELIVEHLDVAFARIWTLDEAQDTLMLRASAGLYTRTDGTHSRVPVGMYKIGLIAQERQPHLTNSVLEDPRVSDKEWAEREGMVAFAGHPLIVDDRLLGVIAMFSRHPLSQDVLSVLATIADRIAMGINRRLVEQAFRESEERFHRAVSGTNDGLWDWNLLTDEVYFSPRWKQMLGYEDHEIANHLDEWRSRLHPDDLDQVMAAVRAYLDGTIPTYDVEHRLLHKDGEYRWIRARGALTQDREGRPARFSGSHTDITERKRAEDELRRSEERFRLLVQNSSDIITVFGADGTILYQSPSLTRNLGHAPEGRIGRNVFESPLVHPDDIWKKRDFFDRMLSDPGTDISAEFRLRGADGSWHHIEAIGRNLLHDPAVMGIVANYRDITERKRAEEELRRSEERYRSLAVATSQVVWITDAHGQVPTDLPGWRAVTGQSVEEVRGTGWLNALHPEDRERTGREWSEAQAARSLYETEYRVRRYDGTYIYLFARGVPVLEPDGSVREWVGTCTDITERRRAEDELRRSEASLAAAQRIARLGNWEWDIVRDEERWSDEVYRLFGFEPRSFTPNYDVFLGCVHPDDREHVRRAVEDALYRGLEYSIDHRVVRQDGTEIIVHEQAEVVHDRQGRPVRMFGTVQDITERRRAEEQRRELLDQVERALELRNQFLSIASHELKTPVTLLKGYAQLLHEKSLQQGNTSMLTQLRVMNRQADRMIRLINDLLDVSRIESGKMELEMAPFSLNQALKEVVGEIRVSTPKFTIRVEEQAEDVWVCGDRLRIQQVMTNLLTNAVKYSGKRREAEVCISGRDGRAVVAVTDYGIGIPIQQQEDVFNLYFRGENVSANNYGGLGLGLYISKSILDRHGGTIGLVSQEGKGSTFTFTLPSLDRPPRAEATTEGQSAGIGE